MKKVGLVLEGGAFRGIFTAGALDALIDRKISFPYVVGVSAGSGNAVNYIAGQKGRTKKVITHENADPYFGLGQFTRSGKLLDLDKMLLEYSYEQIPLDFKTFFASPTESEYVAANCESGEAEYLSANGSSEQLLRACKATCSVPFVCEPVQIGANHYIDGSVIDSVPFERALARGCDGVVVILTRKEGENPTNYAKMKLLVEICYRKKYPRLCDAMLRRRETYDRQIRLLRELERAGRAIVLRPTMESISHFENDKRKINRFYHHGYDTMKATLPRLREFLGLPAETDGAAPGVPSSGEAVPAGAAV